VSKLRASIFILGVSMALLAAAPASATYTSTGLLLTVYSDGYVHVAQSFSVDRNATSVQLPLLSAEVSDLVATDQDGSPLSYGFGAGGNITVYTLGASAVTLRYDTNSLTSKNGSIWTLAFSTGSNSTVLLPPLSTLSSVSGTPYSINETGTSPEVTLPAGAWEIGYGVPITSPNSTTTATAPNTTTGSSTETKTSSPAGAETIILGAAVVLAVLAAGIYVWRRQGGTPGRGELRPDDVQVLDFIREKGGKVLEPEIRMKFALPKTSAWRQIKRLERLGYVRVTKIGSQNQIELLKGRATEP
jgi:uncharacterized membrane protein